MTIDERAPGLIGSARLVPRRTPEAQADIAAARAPATEAELDAQLSDEALRATPAVREMGGPRQRDGLEFAMQEVDRQIDGVSRELRETTAPPLPPDAIVLTGADAARYRAVQAASVAALEAQQRAATASKDLRDAIQTMCAALAPAKEG